MQNGLNIIKESGGKAIEKAKALLLDYGGMVIRGYIKGSGNKARTMDMGNGPSVKATVIGGNGIRESSKDGGNR